jgi:prepilin-type processing-associated H-X9-DG protein
VHARLLPYLEQPNLNRLVDPRLTYDHPSHNEARLTRVALLTCPSDDPDSADPGVGAATNYHVNQGNGILWSLWPDLANNPTQPPPNGVMYRNSNTAAKDVTDGLSHTAAFAERCVGDGSNAVSTPLSDTYRPGTRPANPDEALRDCLAVNVENLTTQGVSDVGTPWLRAYHSTTMYFHGDVPNGRSCMFPPGLIMTTASSQHRGGVNLLMCDGSARFVNSDVELAVWRAIGSRDGQEIADSGF